jgi:hypothetical protein
MIDVLLSFYFQMIPPPPPVCPDALDGSDALGSMLISWYMSGYHTGYYMVRMLCILPIHLVVTLVLGIKTKASCMLGKLALLLTLPLAPV